MIGQLIQARLGARAVGPLQGLAYPAMKLSPLDGARQELGDRVDEAGLARLASRARPLRPSLRQPR